MAATIKIKNSSTAGAAPTSSDLVQGELAVNVTDKRLYTENSSGTVVELGTNPSVPVTFPDGSASAPSLTNDGDTNTGIFFPAADTVGIATGGTERLRLDSSGNLGLGVTPSAWSAVKAMQIGTAAVYAPTSSQNTTLSANNYYDGSVFKYMTSDYASYYQQFSGQHRWYNAASGTAGNAITFTQAMTLDASGNLGVGTTSPGSKLHLSVSSGTIQQQFSNGGTATYIGHDSAYTGFDIAAGGGIRFRYFNGSSYAEGMRLDTSGNLLVGTTDSSVAAGVGFKIDYSATTPYVGQVINTAGNTNTYHFYNENATNNGFRFYVNVNGGVYNYSGNNSNLSDERTKTNIELAGNYLNKICAIPVKLFNYKDEVEGEQRTLGVIAQDVEAVAPELVDQNGWLGEAQEGEAPLKSIYTTDMMFALMKAIQEQQQIITQLQADVAALKGQA